MSTKKLTMFHIDIRQNLSATEAELKGNPSRAGSENRESSMLRSFLTPYPARHPDGRQASARTHQSASRTEGPCGFLYPIPLDSPIYIGGAGSETVKTHNVETWHAPSFSLPNFLRQHR